MTSTSPTKEADTLYTTPIVTCGIDIGSDSTKVVLGSHLFDCEIVRNDVGGHTTPTVVSFIAGTRRQIGTKINSNNKNTIIHLNRLLSGESTVHVGDEDPFQVLYVFDHSDLGIPVEYNTTNNSHNTNIDHDDDSFTTMTVFTPAAIIAMLLGTIRSQVLATMDRIQGPHTTNNTTDAATVPEVSYLLSVGPDTSVEARRQLLDAAFAAGMGTTTKLVERSHCYHHTYQRKFPETRSNTVMIVDMGHCQTTISILHFGGGEGESMSTTTVLSSIRHKSVGAGSIDLRLWNHFQSTIPQLADITKISRSGQRLLTACSKLKQLLSQLPEASVTVENINDADIKLKLTRQTLHELCLPEQEILATLIKKALEQANPDTTTTIKIDHVEAVGGGCRIPWVQSAILEAVKQSSSSIDPLTSLSHSLDDTSIALGAALIGELSADAVTMLVVTDDAKSNSTVEDVFRKKNLRELEQVMASLDEDVQICADTLNQMEALVLELRSAKHNSKHGATLLPTAELNPYLDAVDDWIFSDEAQAASKIDIMVKLEEVVAKTNEMCQAYHDAIRQDVEAKEREMEEEAKAAQLERSAAGDEEEDDHDNRRLPKKRRMEIVMKNKAEANELFSDGNYKFAAARYTKALSHCAKFVDTMSPDDIAEVNAVKLSLNLNLALAYIKLERTDQALRVCNDALAIDDKSTKALYRRGSVYCEKKKWDEAKQDAEKATSLAPDDKAIKKLLERIDVQQKRQKQKEKKMAMKMFG